MGRGIIKIKDRYFDWSTVVDAPVTYAMTQEELTDYVRQEYGTVGLDELPRRLQRVEETGTSFLGRTLRDVIGHNRAGDNETSLSADGIYRYYTRPKD